MNTLVIVINWNGDQELIACLDSLQKARVDLSRPYDVLVLDNASTSGSFHRIKVEYPWVYTLQLSVNLFWAGGNNAAVKWALARDYNWLVFCNSDIIVDRSWFPALEAIGHCDGIGACGFKVFGEVQKESSSRFDQYCAIYKLPSLKWVDDIYISGCFLAVKTACFTYLGGFDNSYKMYFEEHDFLNRVRLAGWRTVRCNAPIYHVGELASRKVPLLTSYFSLRNNIRIILKFGPLRLSNALKYVARVIAQIVTQQGSSVDLNNCCRRRERPSKHIMINFLILGFACAWNILCFPFTILACLRDAKLCRSVREIRLQ